MRRLFKLSAAPIAALAALTFVDIAAPPASAHTYEYCRTDNDHMLHCEDDTLAQCKATASGRGGVCGRDPFLGGVNGEIENR